MADHKATPEQWADAGAFASDTRACLLELRDRIAALEAQRETEKAAILDIYEKLNRLKVQHESNWSRIVKLEEAANYPESPDGSPAPTGELLFKVGVCVAPVAGEVDVDKAKDVLRLVAQWLDSQGVGAGRAAARWLREELER